jgi:hypothetical protein
MSSDMAVIQARNTRAGKMRLLTLDALDGRTAADRLAQVLKLLADGK